MTRPDRPARRLRGFVDLHTHSSRSDGSHPPAEVASLAKAAGLAGFALTDHDTVSGLAEAKAAADELGLELATGVEISVDARGHDAHLLGYFFDPKSGALRNLLARGTASRDRRNPRIVESLRALGVDVTLDEVVAHAGKQASSIGRPHVAAVLVAKGVVSSVAEAFDRYLAEGRPAFVRRESLAAAEAIEALHAAGGLAVLAHASTIPASDRASILADLVRVGIDGLEIVHPKHDEATRRTLLDFARVHDLAVTGGSDFHGGAKPEIAIGSGRDGNVRVPADWLENLRARVR